ncbi:hypothetical protein [Coraliomargarita parva]|uniref:hypothetical protein n=1 Tax=Coraliomargarita parva TaxID=3014050 RepID=UPI0022B2FE4E|nr:hypothetical protein [Coraliomargarita parva]
MKNKKRPPSPQELLKEAEETFTTPDLRSYADVIMTLRDKGLSWRNIASWLCERNIECTYNEVYYIGRQVALDQAAREAERQKFIEEHGFDPWAEEEDDSQFEHDPVEALRRKLDREKEDEDRFSEEEDNQFHE